MAVTAGDFFGVDISGVRGTASANVEIVGMDQVVAKLNGLPKVVKGILGAAMRNEAEKVMILAKDRYVPIDTGQLRDSGKVRGPVYPDSKTLEVWLSFGPVHNPRGSAYAVPVHEIPERPNVSVGGRSAHHEHGSWKYLQIPFLIGEVGMTQRLGEHIDALLPFLPLI